MVILSESLNKIIKLIITSLKSLYLEKENKKAVIKKTTAQESLYNEFLPKLLYNVSYIK